MVQCQETPTNAHGYRCCNRILKGWSSFWQNFLKRASFSVFQWWRLICQRSTRHKGLVMRTTILRQDIIIQSRFHTNLFFSKWLLQALPAGLCKKQGNNVLLNWWSLYKPFNIRVANDVDIKNSPVKCHGKVEHQHLTHYPSWWLHIYEIVPWQRPQ